MTDYAPRNRQDLNVFANHQSQLAAMSNFANDNGLNYVYSNNSIYHPTVTQSYPSTYSTPYVPTQSPITHGLYMPNDTTMALQYQSSPGRHATVPSQGRAIMNSSYLPHLHANRNQPPQPRFSLSQEPYMADTESQDSFNDSTMLSEPIFPALEGYPDVDAFNDLMKRYVQDLSPKKRDKALIHARRAANIRTVLIDKKTTSVESAQFRFWVKKMFQLLPNDSTIHERKRKICHEGKPVAVREKLFKILTKAHKQCQHGGRDKTSAQVRKVYSWVPKELISRFVKLCPTCQVRRRTTRSSPPNSEKSPTSYGDVHSPDSMSPSQSRRQSLVANRTPNGTQSSLSIGGFSSTFQSQNRWMVPNQPKHRSGSLQSGPSGGITSLPFENVASNFAAKHNQSSAGLANNSLLGGLNMSTVVNTVPVSSGYTSSEFRAINGHRPAMTMNYGMNYSNNIKEEGQF